MSPHSLRGKRNQANGMMFEIKVHNKIKRSGADISARSSGSKGFADIISAVFKTKVIRFSLCKANGYLDPKERKEINRIVKEMPKLLIPKIDFHYYKSKRKMGKMLIDNNWEERYNRLKPYQENVK
jgi:hypothetical protein